MPTNPWLPYLPIFGGAFLAALLPLIVLVVARSFALARFAPAIERLRARLPAVEAEAPPLPRVWPELALTHRGCKGRIVFLAPMRRGEGRSPWTALRLALPIPAPADFQLVPKDALASFVAKATGSHGFPTRDAAFDERFVVATADPRGAQSFLDAGLRAAVLDLAGATPGGASVRVEVERKVVEVRTAATLVEPEALDAFVARALRVFDHVHDRLAAPGAQATRPAPAAAPPPPTPGTQGRNLPLA